MNVMQYTMMKEAFTVYGRKHHLVDETKEHCNIPVEYKVFFEEIKEIEFYRR